MTTMTANEDIRFYDTCSLLLAGESLFDKEEHFIISSITFQELEKIKTSNFKDSDIKYAARLLLRLFEQYPNHYEVVIHQSFYEEPFKQKGIEINDDIKILSDALWYNNNDYTDRIIFVTNDLNLKHIASLYFGSEMIESVKEEPDNYKGFIEI